MLPSPPWGYAMHSQCTRHPVADAQCFATQIKNALQLIVKQHCGLRLHVPCETAAPSPQSFVGIASTCPDLLDHRLPSLLGLPHDTLPSPHFPPCTTGIYVSTHKTSCSRHIMLGKQHEAAIKLLSEHCGPRLHGPRATALNHHRLQLPLLLKLPPKPPPHDARPAYTTACARHPAADTQCVASSSC
jgi:hypothetical protein